MTIKTETEEVVAVDGLPLRLSFTPDAIREHFEGGDYASVDKMSDEELAQVGATALTDDGLYRAFHEALVWGPRGGE